MSLDETVLCRWMRLYCVVGGDCTVSLEATVLCRWMRLCKSQNVSHHGVVMPYRRTLANAWTLKCCRTFVMAASDGRLRTSCLTATSWKADHKYAANHGGTASSMESVGAARMFRRSEFQHDLRYVNYLSDGDSSSFKSVQECRPHGGECLITKMECIGHVQKRVSSRLRKLKMTYKGKKFSVGKGLGGVGHFTKVKIDKLQNYFGLAIHQNVGDIIGMQNNLMASLYHVCSTNDNPNHHVCPSDDNS